MAVTIQQIVDAINQVVGGGPSSADDFNADIAAQERMNDVLKEQIKIIEAKGDSDEKAKELNKIEIEQLEALQKRRESEIQTARRSNKVSDTVLARMEAEQAKRAEKIDKLKKIQLTLIKTPQLKKHNQAPSSRFLVV